MCRRFFYIVSLIFLSRYGCAQTGGDNVYEFLNLTHSGLVASLGGANVSLNTGNLNLSYHNPSLLSTQAEKSLALNYVNYFAGINYGQAMYSWTSRFPGTFAAGITYLNYGTFTESDPSGITTGTFSASEYAASVLYSFNLDSLITLGVSFKPVFSHLEKYTSLGFGFDAGVNYQSRSKLFSAGLVLRNAGLQLTTYAGEKRQQLPFEIMAGATHKLAHAPFRFSVTLRHLEKFDLTYRYEDDSPDETGSASSGFLENAMRHVILGTEIIPHKNFYISAGYNYQRRRELQVDSNISTVGFSWGFGINSSFINLEFGKATYHLAGSSNHISLIIRPHELYSRFIR